MNILMVHGVNTDEEADPYQPWVKAITGGLQSARFNGVSDPTGVDYNDIFEAHKDNILIYGAALAELLASLGLDAVTGPKPGAAPVEMAALPMQTGENFLEEVRWTAGMVAQWVAESSLRAGCRDRLVREIEESKPDVIFAHSLGSLICYDLFANDPRGESIFTNGTFVTFGCQIANPFIKDKMWGGRVEMVKVGRWINLFNPNDRVFVQSIDLAATNFIQFTTIFGAPFLDVSAHEAVAGNGHPGYLDNPMTDAKLWPLLAGGGMALLIARNIQIIKRAPKKAGAVVSLPRNGEPSSGFHIKRRVPRVYRYRPPRADHHLLRTAPRFAKPDGAGNLPSAVDLRSLCLPIRDQGSEGACSGFATAAFREINHAVATGSLLSDYLAPAYLYARCRIDEGTFPKDSGASIADEFDVLQNFGVCGEAAFPYTDDPSAEPASSCDVAAVPFRIGQPILVDRTDTVSVKSVLASKKAIAIGFTVYSSFESPQANGVVPLPTRGEEQRGGHGVLVCGYDDINKWWIVRNQWGQDWGVGGYCYMLYGYEAFWLEAWTSVPTA